MLFRSHDHPGETIANLRDKALETISGAKEKIASLEEGLADKAKDVAAGADEFVHRNPWEAIGVAAGLGILIGLLIRRR